MYFQTFIQMDQDKVQWRDFERGNEFSGCIKGGEIIH
jgi:hypothetical protein